MRILPLDFCLLLLGTWKYPGMYCLFFLLLLWYLLLKQVVVLKNIGPVASVWDRLQLHALYADFFEGRTNHIWSSKSAFCYN